MYSMVLMAALTTATDMPDFGRRGGCHGCWGGCYGGCYGGYGWGCRGGCYGCWGGYGGWGGCYGWGGGCYGGYAWGGWGGGYGGYAGWGGMGAGYAAVPMYAMPMLASNTVVAGDATTSMYYNPDPEAARKATITVHLPANAKLSVDGKATKSTTALRRFVSPPLESGQSYHYVLKAEIDRDGEPMSVTERVDFRAGDNKEVTLQFADRNSSSDRKRAPERSPDDKDKNEKP